MTNLPATLSTLNQEISVLTDRLKPVPSDAISRFLVSMQSAGMGLPTGIKPADLEKVYAYALDGVPGCGLRKAVEKLIKGEYENIRLGFIPTPPELAAMARAEAKVVRDDLTRAREKHEAIAGANRSQPVDPKARERVKALLSGFKAGMQAAKEAERGVSVKEEMTPEQAAYWRKIMDAPARRDIAEEQRAFNRKIEAEIAAAQNQQGEAA